MSAFFCIAKKEPSLKLELNPTRIPYLTERSSTGATAVTDRHGVKFGSRVHGRRMVSDNGGGLWTVATGNSLVSITQRATERIIIVESMANIERRVVLCRVCSPVSLSLSLPLCISVCQYNVTNCMDPCVADIVMLQQLRVNVI